MKPRHPAVHYIHLSPPNSTRIPAAAITRTVLTPKPEGPSNPDHPGPSRMQPFPLFENLDDNKDKHTVGAAQ